MEQEKEINLESGIKKVVEDLFDYAVDQDNLKAFMQLLPEETGVERDKVEYELMIFKIVSVGWSINYCLGESPYKEILSEGFWISVHEFSKSLSETTGLMIGKDIDYFQIIRERFDTYLEAMHKNTDAPEPSVVIGPEFARICGNKDDPFTIMTGVKMFKLTTGNVKDYLDGLNL